MARGRPSGAGRPEVATNPSSRQITDAAQKDHGWWVSGTMRPMIDRTYPLEQVPEALTHLGKGRSLGKVLIAMVPAAEK